MELEFTGGGRIPIGRDSTIEVGRKLGLGFGVNSSDRTVSRCHLSLQYLGDDGSRVSFRVIGRNPIWVCPRADGDKALFRNSETGELRAGDHFSLSLKYPKFICVRTREGEEEAEERKRVLDAVKRRERRTRERKERGRVEVSAVIDELESELGLLDVSLIDPVKEFGFLVKGREFDGYPRQKIRPFKGWNFFLEEARNRSDDDDDEQQQQQQEEEEEEEEAEEGVVGEGVSKGKKDGRTKKRKGKETENEDDNWTGESEDEKETVAKLRSGKRQRYSTRLKDRKISQGNELDTRAKSSKVHIAEKDDDEDETLGGFIADDEEVVVTEDEVEEEFNDYEDD
ncbi:putative transcription factor interactor and regulator FHA-SMAD family [Dioscorea sansibarensis]